MSVREAFEVLAAERDGEDDDAREPLVLGENQYERIRQLRRELNWMSARTCKRQVCGDWTRFFAGVAWTPFLAAMSWSARTAAR